jgi:hypothetical protein
LQTVVFYISGHGFGHASRDIEVINALFARRPDLRVVVRTTAPKWLFDLTVKTPVGLKPGPSIAAKTKPVEFKSPEGPGFSPGIHYHHSETDTGIAQIDSLHLDADATVRRAREFMRTFDARVHEEAAFLERQKASIVVADLPPVGIAAGDAAGVPAVALGNFTWDWIYSAYAGADDIVDAMQIAYRRADLALRLPMHGGFTPFTTIIDLPFIARRSTRDPLETRRALGFPENERLVLVSFGGYGLEGLDLDALSRLEGYVALVSGSVPLADLPEGLRGGRRGSVLPFDEQAMYSIGLRYEDVVRAVDVVVTKPGYGIIAECLANQTALLYTSRGDFIEYDVLVNAMPRFLRAAYIDHADLFAGEWTVHLDALLAQPDPPERPRVDGADAAADLLLDLCSRASPV